MSAKQNIALTSIKSHAGNKEKGVYPRQEAQVLQVLTRPMTAREVRDHIAKRWQHLELSSVHRAINYCRTRTKEIVICGEKKCPTTNKTVRLYEAAKEEKKEGSSAALNNR